MILFINLSVLLLDILFRTACFDILTKDNGAPENLKSQVFTCLFWYMLRSTSGVCTPHLSWFQPTPNPPPPPPPLADPAGEGGAYLSVIQTVRLL